MTSVYEGFMKREIKFKPFKVRIFSKGTRSEKKGYLTIKGKFVKSKTTAATKKLRSAWLAKLERLRKQEQKKVEAEKVKKTITPIKQVKGQPIFKDFDAYKPLTKLLIIGGALSGLALLVWAGKNNKGGK